MSASGRKCAAALAPPSGKDRPASAGPHPQAETVGTAASPVARLESTLGHGKTPISSNSASRSVSPEWSVRRALRRNSDLLTIRLGTFAVKRIDPLPPSAVRGPRVWSTRRPSSPPFGRKACVRSREVANVAARLVASVPLIPASGGSSSRSPQESGTPNVVHMLWTRVWRTRV